MFQVFTAMYPVQVSPVVSPSWHNYKLISWAPGVNFLLSLIICLGFLHKSNLPDVQGLNCVSFSIYFYSHTCLCLTLVLYLTLMFSSANLVTWKNGQNNVTFSKRAKSHFKFQQIITTKMSTNACLVWKCWSE